MPTTTAPQLPVDDPAASDLVIATFDHMHNSAEARLAATGVCISYAASVEPAHRAA
ncbi:MAG TPA: hypothetical protein VGP36_24390 [Mycobacteriales bacterium]|jgi:hypothetical protein|nr:hypothetical protein [Mycobacteriales bacterium]